MRRLVGLCGTALAFGLCLAATGLILWYDNELANGIQSLRTLPDWQPWLPPAAGTRGFWTGMEWAWAYRMPVFAACMALTVATAFWPSPDPSSSSACPTPGSGSAARGRGRRPGWSRRRPGRRSRRRGRGGT